MAILVQFVQNILPVDRWVQSVGNVLKYLALTLVILAILFGAVLLSDWGLSSTQRFVLAILILILLGISGGTVVILARSSGDALFSPYERSLSRGRYYGSKDKTRTRYEVMAEPAAPVPPELSPPSSVMLPPPDNTPGATS